MFSYKFSFLCVCGVLKERKIVNMHMIVMSMNTIMMTTEKPFMDLTMIMVTMTKYMTIGSV